MQRNRTNHEQVPGFYVTKVRQGIFQFLHIILELSFQNILLFLKTNTFASPQDHRFYGKFVGKEFKNSNF